MIDENDPVEAPDDCALELERAGLIVLADRPFVLTEAQQALLTPDLSGDEAKNISYNPRSGRIGHAAAEGQDLALLTGLMARYLDWSRALVVELCPRYEDALQVGRTSFRPRSVDEAASPRKDDRRLHVDAFPSSPVGGRRILRVFSNINPTGEARVWAVGEPFDAYAGRFLARARRPLPGEGAILRALGVTKTRRTAYDALMLGLHDAAKLDDGYQASGPRRLCAFPPGATWIVFSDSTVHAALAGRYALEQTFFLPVEAMAEPARAPLLVLEGMTGRRLA